MPVHVFAGPGSLFLDHAVHDLFYIVGQLGPGIFIHDHGKGIDHSIGDGDIFADFSKFEILHHLQRGKKSLDHTFLQGFGGVGHGHTHLVGTPGFKNLGRTAGGTQIQPLEIGKLGHRGLGHDIGRGCDKHGQNLDLVKGFGLVFIVQVQQHKAAGFGIGDFQGQAGGIGHGETAGLVSHADTANVGLAVDDPVHHVFGTQKRAAGKGVDTNGTVRAFFNFGFPSFHLYAGKGGRRGEIGIVQADFFSLDRYRGCSENKCNRCQNTKKQ